MIWLARQVQALRALFASEPLPPAVRIENRRDRALRYVTGGGVAMTIYAGVALYLVRDRPAYVFWLGAGALGLIAVVFTTFSFILGRKVHLTAGKDGLSLNDHGSEP